MTKQPSLDWARRSWKPVRHPKYGILYAFHKPKTYEDALTRPPFGPALLGSRSTAGGRGNRKSASLEARTDRILLAWKAMRLRLHTSMTITEIAKEIGVGRTTVGKWLCGVPSGGRVQARLDREAEDFHRWMESVNTRQLLHDHVST